MKHILFLFSLLLISGCQSTRSPLIGTWRNVEGTLLIFKKDGSGRQEFDRKRYLSLAKEHLPGELAPFATNLTWCEIGLSKYRIGYFEGERFRKLYGTPFFEKTVTIEKGELIIDHGDYQDRFKKLMFPPTGI